MAVIILDGFWLLAIIAAVLWVCFAIRGHQRRRRSAGDDEL